MAAQAFLVVCRDIAYQGLMRVMACDAGDARVAISPAAALLQAISGKTNNFDARIIHLSDVPPGTVARSTEVEGTGGIQSGRIEDHARLCSHASMSQCYVRCARPMTSFAGNSRDSGCRVELAFSDRSHGVAAEALGQFFVRDPAAQRAC
jgi:hypothetical protein